MSLNRIASRVLVAVLVALVVMGVRAVAADAAVYEAPCPSAGAPPVHTDPVCERLEVLVQTMEGIDGLLAGDGGVQDAQLAHLAAIEQRLVDGLFSQPDDSAYLWDVVNAPASEVSGTVALAEGDAMRLDLIWIGVFFGVGVSFALPFARRVWADFRQWSHT